MGDILHALPAVTALRQAHPSWHIGWVIEPRWQALLRAGTKGPRDQGTDNAGNSECRSSDMPLVDRLHFAASRDWKRHPLSGETRSAIKELRRELHAIHYDAVLDLQGAIRSAVIGRMSGCIRRIGEAKPREWPAQWFFTERIVTHGAHVIEVGAAIGLQRVLQRLARDLLRSSLLELVGAQSAGRLSAMRLSQKA
jgi:heptosyltransferase-1